MVVQIKKVENVLFTRNTNFNSKTIVKDFKKKLEMYCYGILVVPYRNSTIFYRLQ